MNKNHKIIIILILTAIIYNELNADINFNNTVIKTTAYKDGYEFANKSGNSITGEFIYNYAIKSIGFRLGACIASVGIPILMGARGDALFLVMLLSPILQAILTIYEIPLVIKEYNKDRLRTINKSVEEYIKLANKDIKYRYDFYKGVNRYLTDCKRRKN